MRRSGVIAVAIATLETFATRAASADYDPRGADGLRVDLERIVTTERSVGVVPRRDALRFDARVGRPVDVPRDPGGATAARTIPEHP